eukprot:158117-Rhodomonas_salina.1
MSWILFLGPTAQRGRVCQPRLVGIWQSSPSTLAPKYLRKGRPRIASYSPRFRTVYRLRCLHSRPRLSCGG